MLEPVYLPQLGQTMAEGTVEKWHKREGERVEKGEVLYELTTDKATLEVQAFAAGVVRKILAAEGSTLPVGELIAVIGDEDDELPADLSSLASAPAAPAQAPRASAQAGGAAGRAAAPDAAPGAGRTFASPRARKAARELGVPLAALAGSGPGGRVTERDVSEYAARLKGVRYTPAAAARARQAGVSLLEVAEGLGGRRVRKADVEAALSGGGGGPQGERIPFSPMRRTIAARMAEAKQTVPHFYLMGEVAMRAAREFLQGRAASGRKATVTALIVRAVALALRGHPRMNARFDGDAVVLNARCNVGVAVTVEDGLFVPVIRDADAKDLPAISAELKDLAETARAGSLVPEQYEGGSVTVSNLGMYGVDCFLPIINPPQACILGVGAVRDRVVVRDGGMAVEPMMELALSADHRVVDGAEAARFFQSLKGLLEQPEGLAS